MLLLLAVVLLLPAFPLGHAPFSVSRVPVAVDAGAIIRCRIEVDHRLRNVREQRAIVADDDDTTVARVELHGQEIKSAAVEVIGGLVQQ